MKKIHFVSLREYYEYPMIKGWQKYQIFTRLPDILPNTDYFYVGPFFTSVDEATTIAFEGFLLLADKELKDLQFGKGPYNLAMGSIGLLQALVHPQLPGNLYKYRWLSQVSSFIGDKEIFLGNAREAIASVFENLPADAECLAFTVFPFGELICHEFMAEKKKALIFRFLEGFSLIENNSEIQAVPLT